MAGGRIWTPEEDALLVAHVALGRTHAEIGASLDRSEFACRSRASNLGASLAPEAVLLNRKEGRDAFRSDPAKAAARSKKLSRCFTDERRRGLSERMRGNKLAVGAWEGKEYPASAKALISAIRSRQFAQQIGLPRGHPMRQLYHQLMRKIGAEEARRIIKDEIARLPTTDQQIIRLQLGASIARKIEVPTKNYDYAAGGASS